ncbi:MAG: homocysteine S-methyltransferase family protein, partial [Muribaculaceae bacterium]|nr:homocysteine S-methyltransferase family protein [Muribaculaceae bacterium]
MTDITEALKNRVLVLDGAMGTMIQRLELDEADFRGSEFAGWPSPLKGCNDLLCLTRHDDIAAIHRRYLEAGADIIETNTFNANAISMADYGLQDRVRDINLAGARIARQAAGVDAWVAGSMGPTNVSLSMPTGHSQTFDSMAEAYFVQASALIEGGVDLLLVETVFDPINAKAAVAGIRRAMEE